MSFLLDNLAAAITVVVLALMLLTVQHRERRATVERNSFYALRQAEIEFVETMERDLRNAYRFGDVAMTTTDTTFNFRTVLSASGADTARVEYRLRSTGVVNGTPTYQVRRFEHRGGGVTEAGASMPTLTAWQIQARSRDRSAVADPAQTEQVFWRMAALTPLAADPEGGDPAVRTVRWEMTIRPRAARPAQRL